MDNKIFVIYVGVLNVENQEIENYIKKVCEKISPNTFEGEIIIIPDFLSINTKIECINPKYITKNDLIDQHHKNMFKLQNELDKQIKIINQITKNENI